MHSGAYGPGFEDLSRRVPRLTRLEGAIGFRPKTSIRTIVGRVIQYEKSELKKGKPLGLASGKWAK